MDIKKIFFASCTVGLIGLVGCTGGNTSGDIDYSALRQSPVSEKPLTSVSSSVFERYLKNGIRSRLAQNQYPVTDAVPTSQESADSTSDGSGSSSGGFSTTNVHEQGVDEADRIKYDGEHLYVVSSTWSDVIALDTLAEVSEDGNSGSAETSPAPEPQPSNSQIRILQTNNETATATEVAIIEHEASDLVFSDIYLRTGVSQLISLSNTRLNAWDAFLPENDWRWSSGKVEIQSYDVGNATTPAKQWKVELEGNLQASRRIGDKLYLITRYIPNIENINYEAISDADKRTNEALINSTPLSDLLPHFQSNDGAIRTLVAPEDCLVSEDIGPDNGYADVVTFVAIDLNNHSIVSSVCLNTNVQGIYSSTTNFYIGGTSAEPWLDASNLTAIHKFSLNKGNIKYKASAALPGFLGWSDPSFRMDEVKGDLRIVTSDYRGFQNDPEHRLTILRENGSKQLQVISTLPNDSRPSPIGKPGEDIFSIRFTDERAYIVTFERIDPLYVIDLKDPQVPKIAGELEIPGFSSYLHPITENWLLGIGNEVQNGRQLGVKVELYDIRDVTEPKIKNTLVIGGEGTNSEVFYDLRALSYFDTNTTSKRLAFPVNVWETGESGASDIYWKESGLYGFDIQDKGSEDYELLFSGKIIAESSSDNVNQNQLYPLNSGIGRSIIHNGAVFYLHGNSVFTDLWGTWSNKRGPY